MLNSNVGGEGQAAEEGSLMWRLNKILFTHNDVARGVGGMEEGRYALFTTFVGQLSVLHSAFLRVRGA